MHFKLKFRDLFARYCHFYQLQSAPDQIIPLNKLPCYRQWLSKGFLQWDQDYTRIQSSKCNTMSRFLLEGKVIIHKWSGEQFLWNKIWNLGCFCASWQYWKKNWADYEQLLRAVFSCFHGQKIYIYHSMAKDNFNKSKETTPTTRAAL